MARFGSTEALTLLRGSGLKAPFIVVGGAVGEEAVVEVLRAGACDFVLRDNLASRLCAAVERGLEGSAARSQEKPDRGAAIVRAT
jgi:FixJ family two-component response regulator